VAACCSRLHSFKGYAAHEQRKPARQQRLTGSVSETTCDTTTLSADVVFAFGNPGDTPIAGDWTFKGFDSVGVVRGNAWYLRNTNAAGPANILFRYGNATDRPLVGDWDDNGTDTPAVQRGTEYLLRNSNSTGAANTALNYGTWGDAPQAGDWNNDGTDSIGVGR
jgi:hypothetical protein